MSFLRRTFVISTISFLCLPNVFGSIFTGTTVHETVTLADLLASQGTGATEIPSYGILDDTSNVTITHDLVGGYNANVIFTSGSIRGDITGGNFFSDSRIDIIPNGGTPFFQSILMSISGEVLNAGDVDDFADISSPIFGDPNPGGGAFFAPGPTTFQFHEGGDWDELPFAPDNTITDLTIEFVEATSENETFELGSLATATPYSALHSHGPGGLDFFNFTLPTAGTLNVETFDAPINEATGLTDGPWGFQMRDTEIGLFDSDGIMIAQNEDIAEFDEDQPTNFYSGIVDMMLEAGDYTLVTSAWNSSLNAFDDTDVCTGCRIGDSISDVTAGAEFGDFSVSIGFTSDGGSSPTLECDFDGDGDCDLTDIDSLYANFGTADAIHDLNGDGMVDVMDIDPWLTAASDDANPFKATIDDVFIIGDANLDGDVSSTDLGLLLNNFGSDSGVGWGGGDFDGNSNVNSTDLGLLLNNFGATSAVAVPEPASVSLIAMFTLLAAACGRRRRV